MATARLTEDDLADYTITFASTSTDPGVRRTIRAAYDTAEPGWVLFKDHKHRTVARVNENVTLMVERGSTSNGDAGDR